MMSVKEYALDIKLTVAEVLKEANKLGLDAKTADDILSDDDIILLDNIVNFLNDFLMLLYNHHFLLI